MSDFFAARFVQCRFEPLRRALGSKRAAEAAIRALDGGSAAAELAGLLARAGEAEAQPEAAD